MTYWLTVKGSSHGQSYSLTSGPGNDGNDLSFPGLQTAGESYYTTSETPYNCSLACRSFGMKYTIMVMGYCNCSPYFVNNITTYVLSGTTYTDNILFTAAGQSGCQNKLGQSIMFCFGDYSQTECGFIVAATNFMGGTSLLYGSTAYSGNYANAVWVDNTFADDSTLNPTTEKNNYGYLGCFNMHTVLGSMNILFIPHDFFNTFTVMSDCFLFCANSNMPYAGIQSVSAGLESSLPNIGNLLIFDRNILCGCGTSFGRLAHQSLPDTSASNSQCNVDCNLGTV